ncbi:MAG: asparagine synthase (glutamine-hydrolyzing) [Rhodanobacteraceae bacterium]
MCGIAGFFGQGDRAVLERMTARITHRGPDDSGFLIEPDSGIYLGFRRLAILDLAGGRQPMTTADGALSIVFNGEIYNFRELRRELTESGALFQTDHSDTEVLLHGYRQWGEDLPNHLNGMWAFAILDRAHKRVFLSRDRFGKKPLFWSLAGDTFVFASELTTMREHPANRGGISQSALRKYFAYGYVPAPLSLIEGVHKLPAGHSLAFDLAERTARITRYWHYRPEPFDTRPANAESRWLEEFTTLLDAAVQRRLVADVPVGCFLSGGIDSSTVTALAARQAGRERIKAFSIGFEEASFDETAFAREVAEHVGVDHRVSTLPVGRALEILPDLAARMDEPIADSSILPTYLLCQHARRDVTVALGGDGADELLAGYDPFRALRYAHWYAKLVPKPLHRAVSMLIARLPVSHRYMSLDFKLKRTLRGMDYPPRLWLPVWMAPLSRPELAELLAAPVEIEDLYSEAIDAWDNCAADNDVERSIAFYIRMYLQDDILTKVDRASMLHSLEVRAPFLDIELVDFLRRLPADMKLRGGTSKWILRKAARPLLPASILKRRKQGFALPVGGWLAEGKLGHDATVSDQRQAFWQQRLDEQRRHRADNRLYLWAEIALANSTVGSTPPPQPLATSVPEATAA